jgi:mRNA interferase HigB
MRIITAKRITEAMLIHSQWKIGLKLWLDTFNNKSIHFESAMQIRNVWKNMLEC